MAPPCVGAALRAIGGVSQLPGGVGEAVLLFSPAFLSQSLTTGGELDFDCHADTQLLYISKQTQLQCTEPSQSLKVRAEGAIIAS